MPTVEIIATIASAGPGDDGNYSDERSVDDLRPLVEAAGEAGMSVVLDLQPGRTDFLTQAQQYDELLALPHVGLALDPEWRLAPDQVHLRQIGSVGVDEVNATAAWLAELHARARTCRRRCSSCTSSRPRMISRPRAAGHLARRARGRSSTSTGRAPSRPRRAPGTRCAPTRPPVHWGWKNFYDEDLPMLDPTQTYQVAARAGPRHLPVTPT